MSAALHQEQTVTEVSRPVAHKVKERAPADNSSLGQMTVGAAALTAPILYEVMGLYAEVIELNQEQQVMMTKTQVNEAVSQAGATLASGIWAGVSSITAGAMGLVGTFIGAKMSEGNAEQKEEMNKATEGVKTSEENLANLKSLQKLDIEEKPVNHQANLNNQNNQQIPQDVPTTVDQLKNGRYSPEMLNDAKAPLPLKEAVAHLKSTGGEDYEDFKTNLNDKVHQETLNLNSHASKVSTLSQQRQMKFQTGSQMGNTFSSVAQSAGSFGKSANDAHAALYSTAANSAGSAIQTNAQGAAKAFEAQNSETQILAAIVQASSRG